VTPDVDQGCVTHHYGCDCRENAIRDAVLAAEEAANFLSQLTIELHVEKLEERLEADLDEGDALVEKWRRLSHAIPIVHKGGTES
jgi:hypothetical protein